MTQEDCIREIKSFLEEKLDPESADYLARSLFKGAKEAREITSDFPTWFRERFCKHVVWLDEEDYSKALIRALWLSPRFAGTDFGTSRQRDMGQVWTDTARGFLGEIAVSKFLKKNFQVETSLDTSRGSLEDFLPTDIAKVRFPGEDWREPKVRVSIKTAKFNGRWLDLPGDQLSHSDYFILVKIGITRHHFIAFLKAISFLKDKLFLKGKELGELDEERAKELWKEIPAFNPIPAYISGYLNKAEIELPIHSLECKISGRRRVKISIVEMVGLYSEENLRNNPKVRLLDPDQKLKISLDPIGEVTGTHFFANSGRLKWGLTNWTEFVKKL